MCVDVMYGIMSDTKAIYVRTYMNTVSTHYKLMCLYTYTYKHHVCTHIYKHTRVMCIHVYTYIPVYCQKPSQHTCRPWWPAAAVPAEAAACCSGAWQPRRGLAAAGLRRAQLDFDWQLGCAPLPASSVVHKSGATPVHATKQLACDALASNAAGVYTPADVIANARPHGKLHPTTCHHTLHVKEKLGRDRHPC